MGSRHLIAAYMFVTALPRFRSAVLVGLVCTVWTFLARAEPVRVRHKEGLVHGFLVLRSPDGKLLADGDLTEGVDGENVTSRLVFHFLDGSIHDETTVYSQHGAFRVLRYHLVQNGPSFKDPVDISIDSSTGEIQTRSPDGKETKDRQDLPTDLANGLVLTLLKNIRPDQAETDFSMLAATPKLRLVKLVVTPIGEEPFAIGESHRKAMKYQVKVEIGGIKGWLAHAMGKLPPPTYVWILEGDAPAFVKSEGPLSATGPVWRIELASPTWSKTQSASK